jgi:glycyl-tRNA synthetase beta chain
LLGFDVQFGLDDLYDIALNVHTERGLKRSAEDIRKELNDFFSLRVKNWLSEQGHRYDVVDAAMAPGINDLVLTANRASAVGTLASGDGRAEFKLVVEQLNRISNLSSKATSVNVTSALFAEAAEGQLYETWLNGRPAFNDAVSKRDARTALQLLAELKPSIQAYFDSVMVMAEDEEVRANRLAMLKGIAADIAKVADFSKLVW